MDGVADVPDCRPSPMHGKRQDAPPDERSRRLHVDDFGGARIADRTGAAHDQDRLLVDARGRIVDAMVIILRPIKHHDRTLEGIWIVRIVEIALPEIPD